MDYNSSSGIRSPFSPRVRQSISGRRPIGINSANKNQSSYLQSQEEQGGDVIYKTPMMTLETYGAPLPVVVTEALTFASGEISVRISPCGWCWVVSGRRVLAWPRTAVSGEPSSPMPGGSLAARELTLPQTDLAHKADLVMLFYEDGAQMPSCVGVSPEGVVRYWASVGQEGVYVDVSCELAGQECERVVRRGRALLLATTTCTLVDLTPATLDGRATVTCKTMRPPSGWLGGIGRRVSLLFFGSMPAHAETKLVGVVSVGGVVALVAGPAPVLQLWTRASLHEHALRRALLDAHPRHYHGDLNSLEIIALDVREGGENSILLLIAVVNVARSPEMRYAIAHISVEDPASPVVTSVSGVRGAAAEGEAAPRFLPLAAHVVLYTPTYIALQATGGGGGGGGGEAAECVDVGAEGDRVLGGEVCGGAALLFSAKHALLRLAPRHHHARHAPHAPHTPADTHHQLYDGNLSLYEIDPHEISAVTTDACGKLKTAFLFHLRRESQSCRELVHEVFPAPGPASAPADEDVDAALDRTVLHIASEMLDDMPAGDPRWKAVRGGAATNIALGSSAALQVLAQLQDKKRAYTLFLDFLRAVGLWQRLQKVTFEGTCMRTVGALGILAERLAAAIALRTLQHQGDSQIIDAAIYQVVCGEDADEEESSLCAGGALAPGDVCYRRVTRVTRLLLALAAPPRHAPPARHAHIINHVLAEVHKCRVQWGGAGAGAGAGAARALLPALLQLLRRTLASAREEGVGGPSAEAAATLARLLLAEAAPLQTPHTQHLYHKIRRDAIQPFLDEGQTERAAILAEKFHDYELLIQMCIDTEDMDRLFQYINHFNDQSVAEQAFAMVVEHGGRPCAKLLSHDVDGDSAATKWLRAWLTALPARRGLAALRCLRAGDYGATAAMLADLAWEEDTDLDTMTTSASLAKLCLCAVEGGAGDGSARWRGVQARLALAEQHGALPRPVRVQHGVPDTGGPVYSPEELVQMYVECESKSLTEYDYKKALDLTDYIQDMEKRDDLRLRVWCACILRDGWESRRGDSPADELRDKMFFRLVDLVQIMGGDLEAVLPPLEDVVTARELAELASQPAFHYLLKYGYECLTVTAAHDNTDTHL